jgi:hypothetical protein
MSLARLGEAAAPDSIGLDAEAAVWSADEPTHRCVRVCEGRGAGNCRHGLGGVSCAWRPDGRPLFMVATAWSNGPAMVTGELTGRVLALDVSVPCPDFPTTGMPAGLAGARYLPGQPGSRPLYATTRSTSGALSGTGTGGSKMPLRASRSSGGYMPVMAARQASSVAGSCW